MLTPIPAPIAPGRTSTGSRPYASATVLSAPNSNNVRIASALIADPPLAAQCIAVHRSPSSDLALGSAPPRRRYDSTSSPPCDAATMSGVRRLRSNCFLDRPEESCGWFDLMLQSGTSQSALQSTGTDSRSTSQRTV